MGAALLLPGSVSTINVAAASHYSAANLACPKGFEPLTHSLEGCCSIHLS